MDRLELGRKVLYRFAIFGIINEKLIKEDRPMRVARSGGEGGLTVKTAPRTLINFSLIIANIAKR